jgi:hypothetical protein
LKYCLKYYPKATFRVVTNQQIENDHKNEDEITSTESSTTTTTTTTTTRTNSFPDNIPDCFHYDEKNSMFVCVCGSRVKRDLHYHLDRHTRTRKHIKYISHTVKINEGF